MALTKRAVAEIEDLYRGDELTLAAIGARYGMTTGAVSQLARRQGWPKRRGRAKTHQATLEAGASGLHAAASSGAEPAAKKTDARPARAKRTLPALAAAARGRLVAQFYDTILKMLEQMEAEMASGKLGTQEIERAAKSVAAMMGSVGKVTMTGADGDTTQDRKPADAAAERYTADNVERLQREIIERFESIQRRRCAAGDTG